MQQPHLSDSSSRTSTTTTAAKVTTESEWKWRNSKIVDKLKLMVVSSDNNFISLNRIILLWLVWKSSEHERMIQVFQGEKDAQERRGLTKSECRKLHVMSDWNASFCSSHSPLAWKWWLWPTLESCRAHSNAVEMALQQFAIYWRTTCVARTECYCSTRFMVAFSRWQTVFQ